jgi:hypothetical protein
MNERQERVLISTHALIVTDGVRFKTILVVAAEVN